MASSYDTKKFNLQFQCVFPTFGALGEEKNKDIIFSSFKFYNLHDLFTKCAACVTAVFFWAFQITFLRLLVIEKQKNEWMQFNKL